MSKDKFDKWIISVAGFFLFGLFFFCMFKPADAMSVSERRPLKSMPTVQVQTVLDGRFMKQFEEYATDQFPMRDTFRSIKAAFSLHVLRQKDNHAIYEQDGYLAKAEYPLNVSSLDNATSKFTKLYEKYLKGQETKVYLSIIPDKNYFLADKGGYPKLDYDGLVDHMKDNVAFAEYIDIFPFLEISDYYKTDTHWNQPKIVDVADKILNTMGADAVGNKHWNAEALIQPFYGVYAGQYGLKVPGEGLYYLSSEIFDSCIVRDLERSNDNVISMYDMNKATSADPYEMFLAGPKSLITIENPLAESDRQLIVFRDSFGSSIAPLFVPAYGKITLVDIRYISSEYLGQLIDFSNSDVLFLYSTLVLNNSITMK